MLSFLTLPFFPTALTYFSMSFHTPVFHPLQWEIWASKTVLFTFWNLFFFQLCFTGWGRREEENAELEKFIFYHCYIIKCLRWKKWWLRFAENEEVVTKFLFQEKKIFCRNEYLMKRLAYGSVIWCVTSAAICVLIILEWQLTSLLWFCSVIFEIV